MAKIKRSSDDYLRLNKNITERQVIRGLTKLSEKWGMTKQEVCYELVRKGAVEELSKS